MKLSDISNKDLKNIYLDQLIELFDYNKNDMDKAIDQYISYNNKSKLDKEFLKNQQELEKRWYDSIDANDIDYSVYDHDLYFAELFACYIIYSKKHLNLLKKPISDLNGVSLVEYLKNKNIKTIVDLGCGIGYSTILLTELFPDATIYCTNIDDTKQMDFIKFIQKDSNFIPITNLDELPEKVDMFIGFEYFEHILNPFLHLGELIKFDPKYFIIANSFNTRAIGHFCNYEFNDTLIPEKSASRKFNKLLRDNNYQNLKTKYWNNRPMVWELKNI